jgi:hypothetical protein
MEKKKITMNILMILRILNVISIIIAAMWVGFNPDWASILSLLTLFTSYITIENKSKQSGLKSSDIKLFQEFMALLPSGSKSIYIIDKHDFQAPFNIKDLADLRQFIGEWEYADHCFIDKRMESTKMKLYNLAAAFNTYLGSNTWHIKNDFFGVPREWENEQNERYRKTTQTLNKMAHDIFVAYQEFIKIGQKRM